MTGRNDRPDGDDDDRTLFVTQPGAAAPGDDDDRTTFVPMPPGDSADDDRTALGVPPPDPDVTLPPQATTAPPEPSMPEPPRAPVLGKLPAGTLINNNYEITEELNSGGMGEVYRGINIHGGPPVAIKAILQEKSADSEAAVLFKREAITLSHLADETIVRYYNYVHDRDLNRFFLVMEFIAGVPLKDHVAQTGPLSVEEVKTLIRRIAGGLAKAHGQQVFHRDLSPDNIMLPRGIVSEARIIDFGIAKSTVMEEGTMHGRFAGKLKYVAPEQLGHFGGTIGPATDIYGLALLICAAALGKPLDMGSSIAEAVDRRRAIPDLSALDPELRPLLSWMLEPDPADRPRNMDMVRRLVDHPEEIPEHYLGGWVPPAPALSPLDRGQTGTASLGGVTQTGASVTQTVQGLQLPGQVSRGTATGTQSGPTVVEVEDKAGSGGGLLRALVALFVLLMAGAGYYAWTMQGPGPAPAASQPVAGIPAPLTDTREGFLASFETGPCTYVTRVAAGPNVGVLEGYSANGADFAGLGAGYEERFGARPEVLRRAITPAQCAVLDFVRAIQGRGREGLSVYLEADRVASRERVSAQLGVPRTQAVWAILIDHNGRIANLTDRLSQPVGDRRNLPFSPVAPDDSPVPYLVLTVEADSPLPQTVLARNGADAASLLPNVLEDIASRSGSTVGASAALSFLLLSPNAPAGSDL
ncbi:serine/threonine protein kinase [Thetidibacter halocola]|uniref:Protein kinase n=1 Tax=Thetidibacter halocola TaxID=2827239 RepID=A0A8J7WD82_9RHOB|nr:protein kinase [Thetidibacter halocola]MBS0123546.1 protein kinase [Thetidibacter halocola]